MRASPLRTLSIIIRSIGVTLAISIPTIIEARRGVYRRRFADDRLRWWARKLLGYLDLSWRVVAPHGIALPPGRPTMVMTNHSSLYDIPLSILAIPASLRMLTKKELFRVPIWGRGLAAGEFISIDRHDREQAIRDLAAARDKMSDGVVLWIAPEGTRSRSGRLGPFKKGGFMLALETGATIVPMGIRGASAVLPPKTLRFALGREVEIHVGEPIDASAFAPDRRDDLMQEVETRIRRLANLEGE